MNDAVFDVLVVDDNEINRAILSDFVISMGHRPIPAQNGREALDKIGSATSLVLLDIVMPEMTGEQVLDVLKSDPAKRHIPVIMISALDDVDGVARCIQRGADDYLVKPFNPVLLKARIGACLERKRLEDRQIEYRAQIEDYNRNLEQRVSEQVEAISHAQLATIFAMSKLAESRDDETGEHLDRMREYCRVLAEQLGRTSRYAGMVDEVFVLNFYAASPLHDIGKVGIPDRILLKPGRLTPEEFEIMKMHPNIGAETLRAVHRLHPGNAFIQTGIEVTLSHHEKWDGSGYPNGLAGAEIPLTGRILALADVFDALTTKRCYKEAYSFEKSCDIIFEGSGVHFDPDVVDAFRETLDQFAAVRNSLQDSEKNLLV